MPTIRDLVDAIRRRDGVDAAIVLGRDGLLVDAQSLASVDAEQIAAHVPSVVAACEDLGLAANRGALSTAVLELDQGFALVSVLSADALLLVLLQPHANVAQLLFDLRRARAQIAALV
jgi:predicted regulator of Ras-like GTPase activity (Roadblock/LC7/MglB family)